MTAVPSTGPGNEQAAAVEQRPPLTVDQATRELLQDLAAVRAHLNSLAVAVITAADTVDILITAHEDAL